MSEIAEILSQTGDEALLLKRRAEALSKKPAKKESNVGLIFITEFLLGKEKYGIEVQFLQEVFPLKEYTILPGAPDFILGIINIRGKILSVMNIKTFFNLPMNGLTELNRVLVVKKDKMVIGILADEVLGVRGIKADELQPVMVTLTGISGDYIHGITAERLILLDVVRILNDPDIVLNKVI